MFSLRLSLIIVLLTIPCLAADPTLPGVGAAMEEMVAKNEIAGAVTMVVAKDKVLHLESTGLADVAAKRPMTPETVFWIASMTKPITGAAVLMLQDEGKLNVADPVAKYLPGFANLKTPSGKPANLTITQILTHTSGLGEAGAVGAKEAKTLADLVPLWLAAPMQFEPGSKWRYCQSGINAAARIVELVSGLTFDAFLQQRLFDPLGMNDTTFYPTDAQRTRLVTAYAKDKDTGTLSPVPPRDGYEGTRNRPPQGNGGLYSTAPDYARFCDEVSRDATERRTRCRLFPERHLRPARNEVRLGPRHLHPAHAARGRARDALTRHLRTRRRVGHAGVDRSGARRGLCIDGAARKFSEQRRQRSSPAASDALGK
jgi:CubicO group peptidase (beta-lactamase class C family)